MKPIICSSTPCEVGHAVEFRCRNIDENVRARSNAVVGAPCTKRRGRKRMWIETGFRDWQSGGFHLDRTGIQDRGRLAQLLIPLLIAYVWLVSLGRWAVKRGYRRLIDHGAPRAWRYSLFQLGVGWVEHLQSFHRLPPVLLFLYGCSGVGESP